MHVAIKQLRMHSCTCDYGSRALCLRFGFAFKSSPSNRGRVSRAGKSGAAGCSPCSTTSAVMSHFTPFPAASKPTAAFWHTLQWGTTIQAFVEALVGRERQGKRAAPSQLSQTPAQKSRARQQIKAFQIVVARNSKSSQMKACNWECLENVAPERPPSCISTKRM